MAKAKREKTRTRGIFKVADRYEWISYRSSKSGTCALYSEACDAKSAADLAPAPAVEVRGRSFGQHARDWLASYQGRTRRGFSESTRLGYGSQLERWLIPYFDTIRPRKFTQVTKPDVRALVAWLADPERKGLPADRAGEKITPATIERILAPLKAMYAQAVEDDLVHVNPTGVRVNLQPAEIDPDDDHEDRRALSDGELERVLTEATEADRLLLDTLAELGIRWGEVCELRGRDLHAGPDGPLLRIRRAYSVKTGKVKPTKSGYGRRDLPLSPDLARRLWRLQRASGGLLFTSPLGERLNYINTFRRVLRPTLERASTGDDDTDVTWAGFHTFRHTCASLLFSQGRNVKQVQEWLGHHDPGFTLRTYVHLLADGVGGPLLLPVGGRSGAGRGQVRGSNSPETTRNDDSAELRDLQEEREAGAN